MRSAPVLRLQVLPAERTTHRPSSLPKQAASGILRSRRTGWLSEALPQNAPCYIAGVTERTVGQVLEETARQYGDAPALRQPAPDGGYRTYSWNEYRRATDEIAAGLRALGVDKGDIVALNSETRLEFYLADLGILKNGSVAAAMYPNYPPADLIVTLGNAGATAAFVEGPRAWEPLRRAPVRHWILLTGEAEGAITLERLQAMGRVALGEDSGLAERLREGVRPSDPAILYLTSGATGEPKMALVTHQSVVANIDMGPSALPVGPQDATVAFLPSAHIAQRVVMEFLPLRCGMPVTFSESLLKLPQEIRTVRPTILLAPPRMWERIYSSICTELKKRPAAVQTLFYGALGLAPAGSAGPGAHPRSSGNRRPCVVPDRPRAFRRTPPHRSVRRRAAGQRPR